MNLKLIPLVLFTSIILSSCASVFNEIDSAIKNVDKAIYDAQYAMNNKARNMQIDSFEKKVDNTVKNKKNPWGDPLFTEIINFSKVKPQSNQYSDKFINSISQQSRDYNGLLMKEMEPFYNSYLKLDNNPKSYINQSFNLMSREVALTNNNRELDFPHPYEVRNQFVNICNAYKGIYDKELKEIESIKRKDYSSYEVSEKVNCVEYWGPTRAHRECQDHYYTVKRTKAEQNEIRNANIQEQKQFLNSIMRTGNACFEKIRKIDKTDLFIQINQQIQEHKDWCGEIAKNKKPTQFAYMRIIQSPNNIESEWVSSSFEAKLCDNINYFKVIWYLTQSRNNKYYRSFKSISTELDNIKYNQQQLYKKRK